MSNIKKKANCYRPTDPNYRKASLLINIVDLPLINKSQKRLNYQMELNFKQTRMTTIIKAKLNKSEPTTEKSSI